MKKLLLLLVSAALCGSCIDSDYDLGNRDDSITFGDVWRLPLATIVVSMDELKDDTSNIESIFDEVDVWTPTTLPDGADYVDIVRLADATDPYIDRMTDALFAEMDTPSSPKLDEVARLLHRRYSDQFPALPADEQGFVADFETTFSGDGGDDVTAALRQLTRQIGQGFLNRIRIERINYTADLDLDDDTIDMLTRELDPAETVDPLRTVWLYGDVSSEFPVSFAADALFSNAGVAIPRFDIDPDREVSLPEVQLSKEGIESIVKSFVLDVDFAPQRYYPGQGFDPSQTITLHVKLRKTGGLR